MRIVLHEKPHQRGSWSPNGVEGFYLDPALKHYRCYRGWVVKTQRERVSDTHGCLASADTHDAWGIRERAPH